MLAEDQFDPAANHLHSEIIQHGIKTGPNNAISLESEEFFTHLAMVNYDLAKACVKNTDVNRASFNYTVFQKINDSDTREAFINAIGQETYQLPQVELIVQRYL